MFANFATYLLTLQQELDGVRGRNPLAARKSVCCTDIIFLILFLTFWGLLVILLLSNLLLTNYSPIINVFQLLLIVEFMNISCCC